MRRLTLMTALLGLTLLVAPTALAARPKLTVAPRYGKALMPRAWQPVTVTITNPADGAAFTGEVALMHGGNTWSTPVSLAAGASVATVTLNIYERPEMGTWLQHKVILRSTRGEIVSEMSWSPATRPERVLPVLVISKDGDPGEWARFDGQASGLRHASGRLVPAHPRGVPRDELPEEDYFAIVTTTPNQLTEQAGELDPFGIVAVEPGVTLSEAQKGALSRWINAGGAAVTSSGIPDFARLVAPRNYVASLRSNALLEQEIPEGSIQKTGRQLFPEVLKTSGVQAPPFSTIVLFLGAYLIAVVPLQYSILRRLDKREWAWGTTPLLAFGFTAGAYFVGNQGRERAVTYNCAAVIETGAGQKTGAAVARFGLYSPTRATYSLAAPTTDTVFFSSVGDQPSLESQQLPGKATRLPDFSVPQWAMRSVSLHTTNLSLGNGIEAQLKREGEFLTGTITNNTGALLENVQVYYGGGRAQFATLSPGQSQLVHFTCNYSDVIDLGFQGAAYYAPLLATTLDTLVEFPYEAQRKDEAMITAFTREELVPVRVEGVAATAKNINNALIIHAPVDAP
ncbi:MAG: hypothetical protein NTX57_20790 [Armatimonadetes bacterium]|nr:hypothetical protein [Armatimonadota bacterium]